MSPVAGKVTESVVTVTDDPQARRLEDINAADLIGYTPLHWAAARNKPEVAKVLLATIIGREKKGFENRLFETGNAGTPAVPYSYYYYIYIYIYVYIK
jgi:hypothetical protein